MSALAEIEGIGPVYASKLEAIGINSVKELLEKGAHTKDREDIAEKSGLTYHQILEWVNRADLFRIKGIGSEYSDLLEVGGVDTVMELAQRNPANLTAKMAETDGKTDIVRRLPTEAEVTGWIAQAKELPRAVWYEARTRKLATDAVTAAADHVTVTPLAATATMVAGAAGAALVTEEAVVVTSGDEAAIVRDVVVTGVDAETKETVKSEIIEVVPLAAAAAVPILAAVAGAGSATAAAPEIEVMPVPPVEAVPLPEIVPVAPLAAAPVMAEPVVEEKKNDILPIVPVAAVAALPIAAALMTAAPITDERKPEPVVERKPLPVAAPIAAPAAADAPSSGFNLLWPLLFLAAIGVFAWLMTSQTGKPKETTEPVAAVTTPAVAPVAPVVAGIPAVGDKDVLTLFDGGTKTWIEPAADAFNQTRTDGKIVVTAMGSREGRDMILYAKDKVHPVVWSPGDVYWIGKIQADAADAKIPAKSGASVNDPKALLKTYVVLLMPEDKAMVVAAAMAKPQFAGKTWKLMHQIAAQGWASVGGDAAWGKLKLAQTDPTKSNSGMAALTLMYQEWAKENPGKDINDKSFLTMMGETQSAVAAFAPATSELIQQFVSDPGSSDIAIVYESDAIRAIDSGATGMKIVYPSPTAAITVPASVVKGDWVTEGQAKLGAAFVDYLLTDAVQEEAMKAGYRPASAAVAAKTSEMATKYQSAGLLAAPAAATPADTKTREGLIYNWNEWRKK